MPIRRPRAPKPVLRHLAFLEMLECAPEGSLAHRAASASFLSLRLLDHWISLGADMASAESSAHSAAREGVASLSDDTELRASLGSIIDAIVALNEPDAQPLLPRVFALGKLFEQRGQVTAAADVYSTVARHVDGSVHLDLAYDAHMRHGFCLRNAGEFEWADQAYATAGSLAGRARDRVRVLFARVGQAKVDWARGNLSAADKALLDIQTEAEKLGAFALVATVMHDRSAVARHRDDIPAAIRLAFESFNLTSDDYDRERVLGDLATYLMLFGATETARTAFRVMELSGKSAAMRHGGQLGLMELAFISGNEPAFHDYRRRLADAELPAMLRTSFLLDAGRGLAAFGQLDEACASLKSAIELAQATGQHQRVFQIEAALGSVETAATAREQKKIQASRQAPVSAPDDIAAALDELLAEVAAAV